MKEKNKSTPHNATQAARSKRGASDLDEKFLLQPLQKLLSQLLEKHGLDFWDALGEQVCNFMLCECGRHAKQINDAEYNYMHCSRCMTYWRLGATWRHEDESVWRRNEEVIRASRLIECYSPLICEGIAAYLEEVETRAGAQRDCHERSELVH